MNRKLRNGIFAAIGMLILILDSKTALQGGLAGVQICLMQVIPALLPFFVLSIMLSAAFTGAGIPFLRPIGRLCRMPDGSEGLFLLGLLGGYPAGAQGVAQAYHAGQLRKADAHRMLGFCSNAGPSFLFGIASVVFPFAWIPWALWIIHIVSALIAGILLPGGSSDHVRMPGAKPVTLPQALEKAISIMAKVCGWIILFRMLQAFFERWFFWMICPATAVGIIGLMELANGCLSLSLIADVGVRVMLCSAFLSLGGFCVAMQTLSVTGALGLGMYVPGKILQCLVSLILSLIIQLLFLSESIVTEFAPMLLLLFGGFMVIFSLVLRKYEKNSSNPLPLRV